MSVCQMYERAGYGYVLHFFMSWVKHQQSHRRCSAMETCRKRSCISFAVKEHLEA